MLSDAALAELQFLADYFAVRVIDLQERGRLRAELDAAERVVPLSTDDTSAIVTRAELRVIERRTIEAALAKTGGRVFGPRGAAAPRGVQISTAKPSSINFGVWWDADLLREIEDQNWISKWDWTTNSLTRLLTATGSSPNNGTKATPALSADILGDWREEVIWRTSDNMALRVYTTTIPAASRMYTLMHDRQYRLAIVWQNVGYNQPPHPSFYLGEGLPAPLAPQIVTPRRD